MNKTCINSGNLVNGINGQFTKVDIIPEIWSPPYVVTLQRSIACSLVFVCLLESSLDQFALPNLQVFLHTQWNHIQHTIESRLLLTGQSQTKHIGNSLNFDTCLQLRKNRVSFVRVTDFPQIFHRKLGNFLAITEI